MVRDVVGRPHSSNTCDNIMTIPSLSRCYRPPLVASALAVFWRLKDTERRRPTTHCEAANPSFNSSTWQENSFPNLTRHGKHSLLRKCLTPQVFNELKDKKTASGVTLEDIIQGGVCLPYGANPPHGVGGVYAGDAESYTTFASLLNPIIESHHKSTIRAFRLQRFQTNLNPDSLVQQKLDTKGEYILYTRMRLCRSVQGFRFAPAISRAERREIERLIQDCVQTWSGGYVSVMDMTNEQHDDLLRKRLLFKEPNEYLISAGIARDWPDARGVYRDTWEETPNLMIWVNARDHIGIISNAKGGDVQGVFSRMSKAAWALETALRDRGHAFAEDRRLGFLNTSPSDIGPALRASVSIKLVRLGQHKGFDNLMKRLRLDARAEISSHSSGSNDQRYTGIFDIGNAAGLGKTEVQLINIMIKGIGVCIELERRLEKGERLDLDKIDVEKDI